MRTLLLFLAQVPFALADDKKDLALFEGKWELTSSEKDGKKLAAGQVRVVKGDKYTISLKDKELGAGTIKIDSSASPKAIDITRTGGKTLLGIYAFDGDEQKVCIAPPGEARPKEFTSKGGHTLSLWKRIKE